MHEGHRDRVYTKFLREGNRFNDVELAELILFYSIPHQLNEMVQNLKPLYFLHIHE